LWLEMITQNNIMEQFLIVKTFDTNNSLLMKVFIELLHYMVFRKCLVWKNWQDKHNVKKRCKIYWHKVGIRSPHIYHPITLDMWMVFKQKAWKKAYAKLHISLLCMLTGRYQELSSRIEEESQVLNSLIPLTTYQQEHRT
jgi:hypothetical protein